PNCLQLVLVAGLLGAMAGCTSLHGQPESASTCDPDLLNAIYQNDGAIYERPGEFSVLTWTSMDALPDGCSPEDISYVGDTRTGGFWVLTQHAEIMDAALMLAKRTRADLGWK